MNRAVLLIVLAVTALPSHVSAQAHQRDSIVGTWKVRSYIREEIPSGAKSDVMGPHPSGYINYGPDGRMMVIIVGERKKPAGPVATPDEAKALISSLISYAGTYTVDSEAKTVTHHIDVSWDESRTGESFERTYKSDGDRLTLTTRPSKDPVTGKESVRMLIFEKVK
jgi:Lipocalin-like domain